MIIGNEDSTIHFFIYVHDNGIPNYLMLFYFLNCYRLQPKRFHETNSNFIAYNSSLFFSHLTHFQLLYFHILFFFFFLFRSFQSNKKKKGKIFCIFIILYHHISLLTHKKVRERIIHIACLSAFPSKHISFLVFNK